MSYRDRSSSNTSFHIGPNSVCAGQTGITFTYATQSGAGYTWTVPTGAKYCQQPGYRIYHCELGKCIRNVRVIANNACGNASARSKNVSINCRLAAGWATEFNLYPNPSEALFTCTFITVSKSEAVSLRVTDLTGRTLMLQEIAAQAGENNRSQSDWFCRWCILASTESFKRRRKIIRLIKE